MLLKIKPIIIMNRRVTMMAKPTLIEPNMVFVMEVVVPVEVLIVGSL